MRQRPRIWPIVVWSAIGIAILCGLGVWQIFRMGEKQALLADIAARAKAAPISLTEALRRQEQGSDIEFTVVKTKGVFDHAHELHKLSTFEGAPGWEIITPLKSEEGVSALVDRGVVPDVLRDGAKRNETTIPTEFTAVVRVHNGGQGYFDPENQDDKNLWYWWDVPEMLAAANIPADVKVAPFVLQVLPGGDVTKFPRALPPDVNLPNNHMQYIITWFGLAAVLAVIAGLFIAKQMRRTDA
jgi:surfeit locus 1 family protein